MKSIKKPRVLIFTAVLIFVAQMLLAQNKVGIAPVMQVTNIDRNTENPMRLDALFIDIKVIGQVAITTLDMTYFNANSRIMEGEFNFPLGEGQTVSRFALDINGMLREGVVVEKAEARKTFEAIVRRGVDPGMLEMTAGNNFRSRVYPLPAHGSRRIVIAFEQELTSKGANDLYLLPLNIEEKVAKFKLHAEVVKSQVSFDEEANELSNLTLNKWNESYITDFEKKDFAPNKQIALSFPRVNDSLKLFTAPIGEAKDSSYFYINLRPQIFEQTKKLPVRIALLWDNSNSTQNRDTAKEFALLDGYFKQIGNATVTVTPFNISKDKTLQYSIAAGDWSALKQALQNMTYDGATSFGVLNFAEYNCDEILLVSDGISNFGTSEPKLGDVPVYTINSSLVANHSFLTYLAQRSGGSYVNLSQSTTSEALTILSNSSYQFISASIEKGSASDLYPSIPTRIGKSFSLAGKMRGKDLTVVLNFGFGSKVLFQKRVVISADNSTDAIIMQRLWAEKCIAELMINQDKNKSELTRMGKQYGIVTPNTSLLVLERLNDYLQYHIVPPKEMQDEYFRLVRTEETNSKQKIEEHIATVVAMSKAQTDWWNTEYKKHKDESFVAPKRRSQRRNFPIVKDSVVEVEFKMSDESDVKSLEQAPSVDEMREEVSNNQEVAFIMSDASPREEEVSDNQTNKSKESLKAGIQLNAWDPQTPYLKVLEYAESGREYRTYLKLKKEYGSTPSFYLDAADYFCKKMQADSALKILSNIAELQLESPQLLRVLGIKLMALNRSAEAVKVFEKVLQLKGEEPQSYRDLGLAYEANGEPQRAIDTLYQAVKRAWDRRFAGIELIIMNEINAILSAYPKLNHSSIDKRLIKIEPVDIRVVLSWDTDNCDMDLWVTDPNGEKCYYGHNRTASGAKISNDLTQGYGPEEFMIKKAIEGEYLVEANYYGTRVQSVLTPVNLHLMFITNYAQKGQEKKDVVIRLENKKDLIKVGSFTFKTKK